MANADIAPIAEILEDAVNGLPYILVDAPDRENEGDVIIPAQFATPKVVNFMAKHARGLICLAITAERAQQLDLRPMASRNESGHGTAFTVSIEAREGVTTGISAHDRAHTIAVAVDPSKVARDIVSPGHVFPLVARDGGVLVRAGHTEAAVDISRMAGLIPAGVICEIMNDDGTMARLPELVTFAREHGLKIGTITDLIAYRRQSETLVERVYEAPFPTHYGSDFTLIVYRNRIDGAEHAAMVRGVVRPDRPTLVRVHPTDVAGDLLGSTTSHPDYVPGALRAIAAHDGPGIAVFVRDPGPSRLSERLLAARGAPAEPTGRREFGVGAQILRDLGVRDMVLMTSSTQKLNALEGFGLRVLDRVPVIGEATPGVRLVR